MGIALGSVDVLVDVQELQGRQFVSSPSGSKGAVAVVKRFMSETSVFAHQTVVKVSGKGLGWGVALRTYVYMGRVGRSRLV